MVLETIGDGVLTIILVLVGIYALYSAVCLILALMVHLRIAEITYDWDGHENHGKPHDFSAHYRPKSITDSHVSFWWHITLCIGLILAGLLFLYGVGYLGQTAAEVLL